LARVPPSAASVQSERERDVMARLPFFLFAVLTLLTLGPVGSNAQSPLADEPFSERDLYLALRVLIADRAEAARLARAITAPPETGQASAGRGAVSGWVISDEILAVMSLLSDELREKVERYRRQFPGSQVPDEQQRWTTLRVEMKKWLDANPPKREPDDV
jgi:hypothetical protein